MTRAGCTLLAALLLIFRSALAQTNVTGDWDLTMQSPQGPNTVKATFKQDAEKVTGMFKSQLGELPFTGTVTGDDLTFSFTIPVQGQPIQITLTGKVDGDSIAGKARFGGFGEGDWSAKRAATTDVTPAAAPAAPAPPAAPTSAVAAAGQWEITIKTPNGEIPASATLTEDNGKLSGTLKRDAGSQTGEVPVSGTLEGTALKLTFTAQTPQGSLSVTLTGDIDGDSILNGKADIGGMGTMEWTGKRAKQ